MTAYYGGIDLHCNNSVVVVMDDGGEVVYRRRLANDLRRIQEALAPYREGLSGVVVESTYNWYWLVDGLMAAGYRMELAHPTATQPYSGLKHTDDESDAEWLAEMLRLGILPLCFAKTPSALLRRPLATGSGGADRQHAQVRQPSHTANSADTPLVVGLFAFGMGLAFVGARKSAWDMAFVRICDTVVLDLVWCRGSHGQERKE